jgi:hypothetical protein
MGLVAAGLTNVELWLQSACSQHASAQHRRLRLRLLGDRLVVTTPVDGGAPTSGRVAPRATAASPANTPVRPVFTNVMKAGLLANRC